VSIIKRTLEKSGLFTVHTTVSWNVTQASIPPTN
jgi:hypothetical protein